MLMVPAICLALLSFGANAQTTIKKDSTKKETVKKQPLSLPAITSQKLQNGKTITIDYSQPGIKGRTIGKQIAPYGKVWRTGANAATTFEISEDVKINGNTLKKGKYSLYTIPNEKEWVVIFNKVWDQWGTKYNEAEDALRIKVDAEKSKEFTERMTFAIAKSGKVSLMWGNTQIDFNVK